MIDPSRSVLQQAGRELSLLYTQGLEVAGDVSSPAWSWLYERCDLDEALRLKQQLTIMSRSCAVRPTLALFDVDSYEPAGVTVIWPENGIAIPGRTQPGQAAVFLERIVEGNKSHVLVWDVSDPGNPSWGRWENEAAWLNNKKPTWLVSGPDYPWFWQGQPIMPVQCQQWNSTDSGLLPAKITDLQETIDLLLADTQIRVIEYEGAYTRAVLLAETAVDGLRQLANGASVLNVLYGTGNKQIAIIPDSTESSARLREAYAARLEEWAQKYGVRGLQSRKSEAAKSGAAIELELTGRYLLRQQMETAARPIDTRIIQALIATHNGLVRRGQLSLRMGANGIVWTPHLPAEYSEESLIPEGTIELRYPYVATDAEKAEQRKALLESASLGLADMREVWLLDHDIVNDGPDGPNWQAAAVSLSSACAFNLSLAQQGFGLDWSARANMAGRTEEDETETYIPPADVATNAARGLDLRQQFPGRALTGIDPKAKFLRTRSKFLAQQTPMMMGEVRQLAAWLESHSSDGQIVATAGSWGNDADPSPEWIVWLSQGGDAGLAWVRTQLMPVEVAPVEEIAQ